MNKISIKNNWDSITYSEFEQLVQILASDIPEHYKTVNLISLLSGWSIDELEDLPVTVFQSLIPALDFLNEMPKEIKHKNEYEVNGRKYILQADVDKICTAQFLDYTNYVKEENISVTKLASVFLIPEGCKYGEGYDINQVIYDIGCMHFLDVKAVAFFLQLQYAAYLQIMITSLEGKMKKMKLPKKEINKTLTPLKRMVRSLLS